LLGQKWISTQSATRQQRCCAYPFQPKELYGYFLLFLTMSVVEPIRKKKALRGEYQSRLLECQNFLECMQDMEPINCSLLSRKRMLAEIESQIRKHVINHNDNASKKQARPQCTVAEKQSENALQILQREDEK
jgi:hypothetical protein